ncbi:hypothetical protein [Roseovarius salis]|uniref:hypothetical protein n=1 Tax=Roseovarius salis TaxID=3376063 RepID=UPI0037C843EF
MISRILSALLRAYLVAVVVALPALFLPDIAPDTAQIVLIVALLAALLTFMEYFGRYPSIVEFRFAPPFNRLRFAAIALTVVSLSLIMRGKTDPVALTALLTQLGEGVGRALDFPYSPVRLAVLMLPADAGAQQVADMRLTAGVCYGVSMAMIVFFIILVRSFNWPVRRGTFNVWVNLPLFDPTSGGDVVERLRREAGVNVLLGFSLPFIVPVMVKMLSPGTNPGPAIEAHTLIWMMTAWALLPANVLMRGIALYRVAALITAKRRRVYGPDTGDEALGKA